MIETRAMMRSAAVAATLAAALMVAQPAAATVITKSASTGTEVFGYHGATPDGTYGYGSWREAIGSNPPFGTSQLSVVRSGTDLIIQITTPFDIASGDGPAQAADIAISTGNNGIYDLGIALGKQTQSAGLYAVSSWQTSQNLWTSQTGYVYGGAWTNDQSCRGSTDPTCGGAQAADVRIAAGILLANTVTISQVGSLLTIDLHDVLFDQFAILWGTADCGNDTIAGLVDVPEPAGLGLLMLGLAGGGLAIRKRRTVQATR